MTPTGTPTLALHAGSTRDELADKHHLLSLLLQTTQQGFWFIDMNGLTTDVNPSMCALLGRARDQVIGRSVFDFFDGADLQLMHQEIEARRHGKTGGYEIGINRPDGTRVYCFNNATPIYDRQGQRTGSVGLWTDITVRRRAEMALRTYELVANSITDMVSVVGEDQVYRMVNDEWCRRFGLARENVIGRRTFDVLPLGRTDERRRALRECIDQQQHRVVRRAASFADAKVRYIETNYYPYAEDASGVRCVVIVTHDVTEQEESRRQLAASAEYLRRTLNATGDAIYASDSLAPDTPVRFANDQLLHMWGIPQDKAATLTMGDILSYTDTLFVDAAAQRQLMAEVTASNAPHESEVRLQDGRVLLRRCIPAQMDQHALRVWSFRDITERRRAEEALIAARDEADRANRAKSDFLSSMSHELRTPMNAILGFAQLLESDPQLSADQRDNVHEILKGGHHLLTLINQVLDLAKIESGHFELALTAVEVGPLVTECLGMVSTLAERRGVVLSHSELDGAVVRADATRLRQVLLNLLSNAIKYNRVGGSVHVTAHPHGPQWWRILVCDTGAGIDAARMGELFEPFNRLDAERSDTEGTGIGLTITRRIVHAMGGRVEVDSALGVGSTFWIELPATQLNVAAASATTDTVRAAPHNTAHHSVLYIEDNAANTKLVSQILRRRPAIDLHCAATPEQGLALAHSQHPDLILLDINLPGMNGFEVLRQLRDSPTTQTIAVVAVTANAMTADIERARAAGFDAYLTKPLDVQRFLACIDTLLAQVDTSARKEPQDGG